MTAFKVSDGTTDTMGMVDQPSSCLRYSLWKSQSHPALLEEMGLPLRGEWHSRMEGVRAVVSPPRCDENISQRQGGQAKGMTL